MRNYLTIDSTDCRTFGLYISGSGVFNAPTRSLDMRQVPGRDGDLIGPSTRLQNGTLTYPAFIFNNFKSNLASLRAFLSSSATYRRLVDTYHPNEYRMVVFRGPLTVEPTRMLDAGQFDLVFECMPQRWLIVDDTTLTASGTISNPTKFTSRPLLRVWGTGTLGVGSQSITISQADTYTDIDCDICYAYKGSVSKNSYVSVSGGVDFPTLPSGNTSITLGTGITKVVITPRWFTV